MSGPAAQQLAAFLEEVAAPTPAPGGGTSSGVCAALAAALVEMAARLAGDEGAASRAGSLREAALSLAERELTSYEPVLGASGDERAAALREASVPPLEIAEAAAEVAALGVSVAQASSPSVRGDAIAGVLLAEAAAAAAARLVEINLKDQPAAPAREAALSLAERELTSYEPVLGASGDERAAALREASVPPLEIAEAAAEVAALGVSVAQASSPSVRGDAIAGVLLAEAAAAAAARLVEINLKDQPAAPALEAARTARARAGAAREAAG